MFRVFTRYSFRFEATRKEKQRALSFSSPHKYKRELARGENKERERKSRDALEPFSFFGFYPSRWAQRRRALEEKTFYFYRYLSFPFQRYRIYNIKECPLSSLSPGRRRYRSRRRRTRVDARVTLARASGRQRLDLVGIIIPRKCPPPPRG